MGFEPAKFDRPPLRLVWIERLSSYRSVFCEDGKVRSGGRVPSTPEGLRALAASLLSSDRIALEVTASCWEVTRTLEPFVDGSLLIRHGKGDKRREAGMDQSGFEQLAAWMTHRVLLPVGPLFCVIDGPTRGRRWAATAARCELRQLAAEAGVRRRFAPHQLRHAHAVELAREGVAVNIIQRQLGHTELGTTSTYRQGIDPSEIIDAVRSRRQPTISATAGLTL
jgi:Phage integrase family